MVDVNARRATTMHIACCVDDGFAPECAVMLSSLLEANDPREIHVHLLRGDGLSDASATALAALVEAAGAEVSPLRVVHPRLVTMPASTRFPLVTWYRVLLPDLFPGLRRMLYLDTDTLITSSLRPLWETELHGNWVGAVTNPLFASMARRIEAELGLPDGSDYFNSGVLLLDLDALRTNRALDRICRFVAEHPGQPWPDQDALNAVMHSHRYKLHPRWNAMPGLFELPQRYLPHPRDVVSEAVAHPRIVHFVGPHKPLHYRNRHPYRDEWFRHLGATPWRDSEVAGRTWMNVFLRRLPPIWALRLELGVGHVRTSFAGRLHQFRERAGRRWQT